MPESGCLSEALLTQSPACHWIVRSNLVFDRVYGLPFFGKPAAELEGRAVSEVLPPGPAKLWGSRFERALAGERLSLRERSGNVFWNISVFPFTSASGEIFAGGIARDQTPWNTAEQELRNTVLGALKGQEFERNMLSKFLHDQVGQNLTALGMQLDLTRMDLEEVAPATCKRITEIQQVLEVIMEQVRDYSYHLNPSAVERAGLRAALDRMVIHTRGRFAGNLRVNVDPTAKVEPKFATAFFHIAQEAVENAVQHASCSTIEIAVKSSRTGNSIEIRDNGKGFDPAEILDGARGLGLLSMSHHAAEAGLDLSITSNKDAGTTVRATVPEAT